MPTETLAGPSSTTSPVARRQWRAMGTDAEVIVVVDADAVGVADRMAELAVQRIEILEQSWSRFRSTSELSALNASCGQGPRSASADLMELLDRMQQAWRWTAGACDGAVHDAMTAWGYDRDFALLASDHGAIPLEAPGNERPQRAAGIGPTLADVMIDRAAGTIELPASLRIDPGAIGKGLAADIVCREVASAGASGVLVNMGGDISVCGAWLDGHPWQVGLRDERNPDASSVMLTIHDSPCGIATSTSLRRRWSVHGHSVHHIIDPSTGRPAQSDLVQATVIAPTAWQAEAAATAAMVRGAEAGSEWLTAHHLDAFLFSTEAMLTLPGGAHVTVSA